MIRLLEGMENLSELRILFIRAQRGEPYKSTTIEEIVEVGKAVLRSSKAAGRKELRVKHPGSYFNNIEAKEVRAITDGSQWSIITHSPIPRVPVRDWSWSPHYY